MIVITYTNLEPYVNILTLAPFSFDIHFTQYSLDFALLLQAINTFSTQLLQKIDTRSWRSLSGVRVNEQIVQLVPNAEVKN
jgi:poly(A) polymerase Pap1